MFKIKNKENRQKKDCTYSVLYIYYKNWFIFTDKPAQSKIIPGSRKNCKH